MKKILIVEDDEYIGNMIEAVLKKENFAVQRAYSGTEALLVQKTEPADLVLLDLMLPGISGEQILSSLKKVPVIVLSAKQEIDHKVQMLNEGATDYITKPFDLNELVARIRVHLRNSPTRETYRTYEKLVLWESEARYENRTVHLTPTEKRIMEILMDAKNKTISRTSLLDQLETQGISMSPQTLKVHISRLRSKLKELTGEEKIESLWGIGYRLS